MTTLQHMRRLAVLLFAAAALLLWLVAHTENFYADGLRYIAQARTIDRGELVQGLVRPVDHPVYPMAIALAHRFAGDETPRSWQRAAQLAAAAAGAMLVVPLYLIALELFGPTCAWLSCFLYFLIPLNGHVLADALSESSFLLFWSLGLWFAVRFLRTARLAWLPLVIAASVIAYLTRPEGLVLPISLLATLILLPLCRSLRLPRIQSRYAIILLVLGPVLLAGPFMLSKGGISTKPSMTRLLGLAPRAAAMSVERERPLNAQQSELKTTLLATRAMSRALAGATTFPLLLMAPVGIAVGCSSQAGRRVWLFLGVLIGLSALAMIRVHAMAGYCTPRHAMMVGWILIIAGAAGLDHLVRRISRALVHWWGREWSILKTEAILKTGISGVVLCIWGPAAISAIDTGFAGYRQAGEWLAAASLPGEGVIDPKGFSLYYSERPGYTFATLDEGVRDPGVRWLVAHEALIIGPWDYSKALFKLVGHRTPVRAFPVKRSSRVARVYVYDLTQPENRTAAALPAPSASLR